MQQGMISHLGADMKPKPSFVAEIDADELAVRMAEAVLRMKRAPGLTPAQAVESMPADWGPAFRRAASAAMEYWQECIANGQTVA